MKGEIELYNISFLILKVNLHFKQRLPKRSSNGKYIKHDKSFFFWGGGGAKLTANYESGTLRFTEGRVSFTPFKFILKLLKREKCSNHLSNSITFQLSQN